MILTHHTAASQPDREISRLVLTGETTLPLLAASDLQPTYVLRGVHELLPD